MTPRLASRLQRVRWLAVAAAALGLGCAAAAPVPPAAPPAPENPPFSGEVAFGHLEALARIGPRVPGTPGGTAGRAYVRGQLEALGIEVQPIDARWEPPGGEPIPLQGLLARLPGERSDGVLLTARIDTPAAPGEDAPASPGANEASGAAVLLELARVLQAEPLPYTVWLGFREGDALDPAQSLGARALARALAAEDGALPPLRAAIALERVGDADLRIVRDPLSQRRLRRAIFEAAAATGHADAFPAETAYEVAPGPQSAFEAAGLEPLVVLSDPHYGDGEAGGAYWHTAEDTPAHCSAASLEAVGDTVLAALRERVRAWQKIDGLVRHVAEPEEPPAPADAAEPSAP